MGYQVSAYTTWPDPLVSVAEARPLVPNPQSTAARAQRLQEEWVVDFEESVAFIYLGP